MDRILTRPKDMIKNEQVLYGGNHYISLPEINTNTGIVKSLNIGSLFHKALVELRGEEGLFIPNFYLGNKKLSIEKVSSQKKHYYIPFLDFQLEQGIQVTMKIYTDLKEKGLVFDFESNIPIKVKLQCQLTQLSFLRFHSHRISFGTTFFVDPWLHNPLINVECGKFSLAMVFGGGRDFSYTYNKESSMVECYIECKERNGLYMAINDDPDGASTTLIHLKRKGYKTIYKQWKDWLQSKMIPYAKDKHMERVINENLFFNYFFAIGKDMKTDAYFALTSRSPRYYVSGAFWERDSFLWSFPAIKLVDPNLYQQLARDMIVMHSKNPGDHSHYIDGTVLYPGFELDQAASYFILLKDIQQKWMDQEFLWAMERVWNRIEEEYDSYTGLYKTFLLPSDDPAQYPFVTIDNVILWRGFENLKKLYENLGMIKKVNIIQKRRIGIERGINRYLIQEVEGRKIFVGSSDGKGNCRYYNDPPGNLGLLYFYGFVGEEDEVFQNTIDYYYSPKYAYFFSKAPIQELACDHHPKTSSGLGLCGSILNPLKRKEALNWLKMASMDFGLLSESFDPYTGVGKTGVGFATGAGYLAFALYYILIGSDDSEGCIR